MQIQDSPGVSHATNLPQAEDGAFSSFRKPQGNNAHEFIGGEGEVGWLTCNSANCPHSIVPSIASNVGPQAVANQVDVLELEAFFLLQEQHEQDQASRSWKKNTFEQNLVRASEELDGSG